MGGGHYSKMYYRESNISDDALDIVARLFIMVGGDIFRISVVMSRIIDNYR